MKLSKNDPKLTAYVLNELSPEEMNQVAEEIKKSPELINEVQRLQENALQFKKLKTTEVVRLSPAQREKIFSLTQKGFNWNKYFKLASGFAVASLAVVLFLKNESDLKQTAAKNDLAVTGPETAAATDSQSPAPAFEPKRKAQAPVVADAPMESAPSEPAASIAKAPATPAADNSETSSANLQNTEAAAPVQLAESKAEIQKEPAKKDFAVMETDLAAAEKPVRARSGEAAGGASMYGSLGGAGGPGQVAPTAMASHSARAKSNSTKGKLASDLKLGSAATDATSAGRLETERYVFELQSRNESSADDSIAQLLVRPLFKCFENSLLRYSRFQLELTMNWQANFQKITGYSTTVELIQGSQQFGSEIRCLAPKLEDEFKNNPALKSIEKEFTYRLILRSK